MAAAIGCASHAVAAAESFSVLHHEKVQAISAARDEAGRERVSFEAYGRHFELRLEPNPRITRALGKIAHGTRPLQGSLEGAPGSWARLTLSAGGRWHGMFSDRVDVYAIEPARDLEGALVQPAPANAADPVIFRLSDALLPTGAAYCATSGAEHGKNALEALKAVGVENPTRQDVTATRRLLVSVVADQEFAAFFENQGVSAEEAIVQRMNVVDGIFSSQLGVHLELPPPTIYKTAGDPFTTLNANELLEEVRRYRATSPGEMSRGVTHLMTGRDMEGDTVGVAYIGTVCSGGTASSLSEGVRSMTAAALIAAHEIGHNFNAPHDGESGACSAMPKSFLMAPQLNGSQQFSSCSLQQMRPLATSGWCLTEMTADSTTGTGGDDGPASTPSPQPDPAPPGGGDGGGGGGGGSGIEPPAESGGGGMIAFSTLLGLLLALRVRSVRRR
jgi:hypothetical protein